MGTLEVGRCRGPPHQKHKRLYYYFSLSLYTHIYLRTITSWHRPFNSQYCRSYVRSLQHLSDVWLWPRPHAHASTSATSPLVSRSDAQPEIGLWQFTSASNSRLPALHTRPSTPLSLLTWTLFSNITLQLVHCVHLTLICCLCLVSVHVLALEVFL